MHWHLIFQDVLSVAFSVDNRQIVSGSRDKTIKLWNTLAECKYTIQVSTSFCLCPVLVTTEGVVGLKFLFRCVTKLWKCSFIFMVDTTTV